MQETADCLLVNIIYTFINSNNIVLTLLSGYIADLRMAPFSLQGRQANSLLLESIQKYSAIIINN